MFVLPLIWHTSCSLSLKLVQIFISCPYFPPLKTAFSSPLKSGGGHFLGRKLQYHTRDRNYCNPYLLYCESLNTWFRIILNRKIAQYHYQAAGQKLAMTRPRLGQVIFIGTKIIFTTNIRIGQLMLPRTGENWVETFDSGDLITLSSTRNKHHGNPCLHMQSMYTTWQSALSNYPWLCTQ